MQTAMIDQVPGAEVSAKELQRRLRAYKGQGGELARIERETNVNRSRISQLVNHGYPLPNGKMNALWTWLEANAPETTEEETKANTILSAFAPDAPATQAPAVPEAPVVYKHTLEVYHTADLKNIVGYCNQMYKMREIGVIIGNPRTGKTTALREYCKMNPNAYYIECWSSMRMGDMLAVIAQAAGISLSGSIYHKIQQVIQELRGRSDVMLLLDEAEYLKKWDVDKFEVLRKIWDNTGTPIIFCGTQELERVLTRSNCAQLYGRMLKCEKTRGISEAEALDMLRGYNITEGAARALAKLAVDHQHGGMSNFVKILKIALAAAEGGQVDAEMIKTASKYKLMY